MKFNRGEIIGAFGDLGTLLPLAVGLVAFCGMNPMYIFLSAGLFYIITAINFRIPMPVQPLKALCAIAIATKAGADQIQAASFLIGILLLALGLLPVTRIFEFLFTRPVVRGIQLGLGILLVKSGFGYAVGPRLFLDAGVIQAGPDTFAISLPSFATMTVVFTTMVIPQLSLTIGNSVVATTDAARAYFGPAARRVTPKSILVSLGLANILSSVIGGLPVCHGAGGLTAHYKFGARTAACGVTIGAVLVIVALMFDNSAAHVISAIPLSILGAMLVYVGCQHMLLAKDIFGLNREFAIAVTICVSSIVLGNLAYAAAIGILADKFVSRKGLQFIA